ncbi:unnamed protein product [Allacma fusca]|uniref:Uncharacterized protein n=1 Tax=Allacma fusca TaxID=39272 RepID=A0A8J2NTI6_9HEXA|nr:unnamed protein product [Allacma fusca]
MFASDLNCLRLKGETERWASLHLGISLSRSTLSWLLSSECSVEAASLKITLLKGKRRTGAFGHKMRIYLVESFFPQQDKIQCIEAAGATTDSQSVSVDSLCVGYMAYMYRIPVWLCAYALGLCTYLKKLDLLNVPLLY